MSLNDAWLWISGLWTHPFFRHGIPMNQPVSRDGIGGIFAYIYYICLVLRLFIKQNCRPSRAHKKLRDFQHQAYLEVQFQLCLYIHISYNHGPEGLVKSWGADWWCEKKHTQTPSIWDESTIIMFIQYLGLSGIVPPHYPNRTSDFLEQNCRVWVSYPKKNISHVSQAENEHLQNLWILWIRYQNTF